MERTEKTQICALLYDYFANHLGEVDTEKFELHLLDCKQCQADLANLQKAFASLRENDQVRRRKGHSQMPVLKYAIAAVVLLAIGYGLFAYFSYEPPYYKVAALSEELQIENLKDIGGSSQFETALNQLRQRNYRKAIIDFQAFVDRHPESYQGKYFLGLSYLAKGQAGFLGRKQFSQKETNEAIRYLQQALSLAGSNRSYQEQCLWLLGKAHLRTGDIEKAKASWHAILELSVTDSVYRKGAEELLEKFDE